MGDAWSEAAALNKLGDLTRAQSDYAGAGRSATSSLTNVSRQSPR